MPDNNPLIARLQGISRLAAFNNWLGLEITHAAPGEVELQLRWRAEFGQYNGFLHAALVGGLIDTACGFAATTQAGDLLASQFSVRCLRPARARVFRVRGRVVKPGRLQIFTAAELIDADGDDNKPFAVGEALLVPVGERG
jgi:uncharacterized protein (TIGR00369 family)